MSLSDERMEQWIGNLLRAGVLLSAAIVAAGGIVYLFHHPQAHPDYRTFRTPPATDLAGTSSRISAIRGREIIRLGLLLLIATPVARVLLALVAFALQRDRLYALVSLLVLGILLFSLSGR